VFIYTAQDGEIIMTHITEVEIWSSDLVKNDGEVNMQPWELMGNFSLQEHFHFVMKKEQRVNCMLLCGS